jgi:predicted metal-binding membrane protein
MEVQEGFGGCFWWLMGVMFIVGVLTLPFGAIIWIVQLCILYEMFT